MDSGRGRNLEKIGLHAQDTAELFFDDVRVPVSNRLGDEGRGFVYLMENLPQERLSLATGSVAHAQAAFDWTLEYVKERQAFGQSIGSFQTVKHLMAEDEDRARRRPDLCRPPGYGSEPGRAERGGRRPRPNGG